MTISNLWHSKEKLEWKNAFDGYWEFVIPQNKALEKELEELDLGKIAELDPKAWFCFLHDKYFKWKYTAPNRYATTTRILEKYNNSNGLDFLFDLKNELLNLQTSNILRGLSIAKEIPGLGIAGASGLLSLMYPQYFATVDQFVVKALCQVPDLPEIEELRKMNPENLTLQNGLTLINIMRRKAKENNETFSGDFWTPRKIDMVLWASR